MPYPYAVTREQIEAEQATGGPFGSAPIERSYTSAAMPQIKVPGYLDTLSSAWREYNWIVNAVQRDYETNYPIEEGFDVLDYIKGGPYEANPKPFLGVRSRKEADGVMAGLNREQRDKEVMAHSGFWGGVNAVAAGVATPETLLIPAGAFKAAKGGYSLWRSTGSWTGYGMAQAAITETGLKFTKYTPADNSEAIANVASATVLNALLGAAATKYMTGVERIRAQRAIDEVRKRAAAHNNPEGGLRADQATATPAGAAAAGDTVNVVPPYKGPDVEAAVAGRTIDRGDQGGVEPKSDGRLDTTKPSTTPLVLNRDTYVRPGEQVDTSLVASDVTAKTETALAQGSRVIYHVEDRPVEIVAVDRGMMADAQGQRWGVTALLQPTPGKRTEIEIIPREVPAGQRAYKPGEVPDEGMAPGIKLDAPISPEQAERIRARYENPGGPEVPPGARGVTVEDLAASPAAQSLSAAATDTRSGLLRRLVLPLTDRFAPTRRGLRETRPVEYRRAVLDVAEQPLETADAVDGVAATQGPAADRLIKIMRDPLLAVVGDHVDELWAQHRQLQPGRVAKLAQQVKDFANPPPPGTLTVEQFKEEASRVAAIVGAKSSYPEAQELAERIRRDVFDPFAKLAKETIPGFKLVEGEPYFPHNWNKELIIARRPDFKRQLTDKYVNDQSEAQIIRDRLVQLNEDLRDSLRTIGKIEGRKGTQVKRREELEARLEERAMELRATGARVSKLEESVGTLKEDLDFTQKFLDDLRVEYSDPLIRNYADELQRQVNRLRARDVPMTEAQMRGLEEEELRTILTGTTRRAAEMVVGRRKFPKLPSFLDWIAENGGVVDVGGDVASIVDKPPAGLINKQKNKAGRALGHELDSLAQVMRETFPSLRGRMDLDDNMILDWISESAHGRQPDFMIENVPDKLKADLEAAQLAAMLDETYARAGIEPPKKIADVAKVFRDARVEEGAIRLEDLDRVAQELESAGQGIPIGMRRIAAEEKVAARREDFAQMRTMIADTMRFRDARFRRLAEEEARSGEAGLAMERNIGRLGELEERASLAETRAGLLDWMLQIEQQKHDLIRKDIEAQVGLWQGTSANEAKAAIAAAEKAAAASALKQQDVGPQLPSARVGPRLKQGDKAVDRFVRRTLNRTDLDLTRAELEEVADDTINRILGSPDGRMPYDFESGGPRVGWKGGADSASPPRGPLHERRLDVTNEWAWDWIEHDIEKAAHQYINTMVPDLVWTKRFGDVDGTELFRKVDDGFKRLSREIDQNPNLSKAEKEKAQTRNEEERKASIEDLAAMRDQQRRVYGWSNDAVMQRAALYADHAKKIANIVSINSAPLASMADFAGPIIRHGMEVTYGEAFPLLMRMLRAKPGEDPFAEMLYHEIRGFGLGLDVALNRHRGMESWADVYASQSRFGKTLQTANDLSFAVNGLNFLTDIQKQWAGTVAHIVYIRAMRNWLADASTPFGKATEKEVARLASGGVDRAMAQRILDAIDADPKTLREGAGAKLVEVSNPGTWTDRQAATAFAGLVARDADIMVPTPGHESPNIMSHPTLGVLFQFKRILMAGTERILAANLQRSDAQALSGIFAAIVFGMASFKASSVLQGKDISDKPIAEWIREGIDRSNVTGLVSESNNMIKKLTGADVYRPFGAQEESTRFQSRSTLETILGPTAGRVNNIAQFVRNVGGENYSASDTRALRNAVIPWQNLWYIRGAVNKAEDGINHVFGVPERRPQ